MSAFIRFSILLILIGSSTFLHAQVFEGDLKINQQGQLDTFAYTEVTGNLRIEHRSSDNASDLRPLSMLKKVGGDLTLDNYAIQQLGGLDSLREIGGSLTIIAAEIRTLAPLSQLQTLGGLALQALPFLKDLDGLEQLPDSMISLSLVNLPKLESITALTPLTYLHGALELSGLNALTSWTGLENLSSCAALTLIRDAGVNSVDNLHVMAGCEVRDSLKMSGTILKHLDGFLLTDSLQYLELSGLQNVETWPMLDNITWANNIRLSQVNRPNLRLLSSLTGPIESLWIEDLGAISLEGLEGITQISDLNIEQNFQLETLKGLEGITDAGFMRINYNLGLLSLEGLDNLTTVNTLLLESLPAVKTLQHLNQVARIEERLVITWLESLEGLDGFTSLTELTQPKQDPNYVGLKIEQNDQLRHLDGLAALAGHFPTGIRVRNNDLLVDVSGLGQIESVGALTQIQDNPQLNDCCVLRSWLEKSEGVVIAIGNNAPYCQGTQLIEPSGVCLSGVPPDTSANPGPDPGLQRPDHPNPTTGTFTISYFSAGADMFEAQFYDRLGRAVPLRVQMPAIEGWNQQTIDLSVLPPGLYLYRIEGPYVGEVKKVVVVRQ